MAIESNVNEVEIFRYHYFFSLLELNLTKNYFFLHNQTSLGFSFSFQFCISFVRHELMAQT